MLLIFLGSFIGLLLKLIHMNFRDDIKSLKGRCAALEKRIDELANENAELREENAGLREHGNQVHRCPIPNCFLREAKQYPVA